MPQWPLGVFVSSDAGLGVALDVLGELHVPTAHLHAPRVQSRTPASAGQVRHALERAGVEVTVVFAGFEGESYADIPTVARTVGLAPEESRVARSAELLEIADFAHALGVPRVGVHLGFVPHDPTRSAYRELLAVTRDVCDYMSIRGQALHLETGQEPVGVLVEFLNNVERDNLFVNFDPANMILYGAGEPIAALRMLAKWVRSVHCKDAKWSSEPGVTWGVETPLGAGAVNFEGFLRTLLEIGYDGPLTIEREIPEEPERQKKEISEALMMLTALKDQLLVDA